MATIEDFKKIVSDSKNEGYTLVGYGAAAKGMTFLNFADGKHINMYLFRKN